MSMVINENEAEKDPVPSNTAYEIAMVVVAATIMVLSGLIFIVLVLKRRWTSGISYDGYNGESTVSNINLTRTSNDNISMAGIEGPAYISYTHEKGPLPSEIPIGKVKLSRDALLYISLITCMNLTDDIDSEESL